MRKIFRLKGKIQDYAWGGTEFISTLLGTEINEDKKAEYKMHQFPKI